MKHFFSIIFVLIICMSVAGCSAEKKTVSTAKTTSKTASATSKSSKTSSKKVKTATKGIDVSSFSGRINWKVAANQGIEFAMIRLGGRGYGESGGLYTDDCAAYNLENADMARLKVGGYFFSQALNEKEAREEAEYVLNILNGRKLKLPIAYDLETLDNTETRVDNLSESQALKNAAAFRKELESYGYKTVIYIEKNSVISADRLKKSEIWYSDFGKPYENDYYMLQYSKQGKISGIEGSVDLNVIYEYK